MFKLPKFLQGGAVLPLALIGAMALPSFPGCVTDVREDPEFAAAVAIVEEIRAVREGGVTVLEEPVLADLLARFDQTAKSLEAKLDAKAADARASAERIGDAAVPFIPPPFNGLVDPAIMAVLYWLLRRQNRGALDALKSEVLGKAPTS